VERRAFFRRLWEQIRLLPPRQCAALLLNWREDRGRLIEVLIDTQTATVGDLARAMGMTQPELEALWPDLPINDNEIAQRLNVTRQQVINLRACALKRLKSRERAILGEG